MKKFALVQLTPKDMKNQGSVNLGLEIVKDIISKTEGWQVDLYKFGDTIEDVNSYEIIGFSIFYFTQMLNVVPFLRQHGIEVYSKDRKKSPLIMAGGQGIQNPEPLKKIVDLFCMGNGETVMEFLLENYQDIDKLCENKHLYIPYKKDTYEFYNHPVVISEPVIYNKNAMIELTRGCKYRCKFCQYGWSNGKYREKDIELVKKQILDVKARGIKNINFLSVNIGGYSKIIELFDFCIDNGVRLLNTDMRINEYNDELAKRLDMLKVRTLKVGVESFNECVRRDINKPISKEEFDAFIDRALNNNISNLHFYLIYGLPTEVDYTPWFDYVRYLMDKRKTIERNIRYEFSATNFEPAIHTAYKNENTIDFKKKHEFFREFLKVQEETEYIKQKAETKDYGNSRGRVGRKERNYNIGMWLLHGDETVGDVLNELKINGVGNGISKNLYDKIKAICDAHPEYYQIKDIGDTNENIW